MADIQATEKLTDEQVGAVERIVERATRTDGVSPLNEHSRLALRGRAQHFLAIERETLAGYAIAADGVAELVVAPDHRGRGIGRQLATALPAGVQVWSHGRQPAAEKLAQHLGFHAERTLLQLGRKLTGPLPESELPPGVTLRTFAPGADEDAVLAVNARAFVALPDQGNWTRNDILQREREPWFDPAGFFLAERDGRLLGFHWTKVHSPEIGEVYVVGVDPEAQGMRLGHALTLAGLHYLAKKGLTQVMLYVDESNTSAVRLYQRLGFTSWAVDVAFVRTA